MPYGDILDAYGVSQQPDYFPLAGGYLPAGDPVSERSLSDLVTGGAAPAPTPEPVRAIPATPEFNLARSMGELYGDREVMNAHPGLSKIHSHEVTDEMDKEGAGQFAGDEAVKEYAKHAGEHYDRRAKELGIEGGNGRQYLEETLKAKAREHAVNILRLKALENQTRQVGPVSVPTDQAYISGRIPFGGLAQGVTDARAMNAAVERIQKGEGTGQDYERIGTQLARDEFSKNRGVGGQAFDFLTGLPAGIAEFEMTGGVAKGSSLLTQAAKTAIVHSPEALLRTKAEQYQRSVSMPVDTPEGLQFTKPEEASVGNFVRGTLGHMASSGVFGGMGGKPGGGMEHAVAEKMLWKFGKAAFTQEMAGDVKAIIEKSPELLTGKGRDEATQQGGPVLNFFGAVASGDKNRITKALQRLAAEGAGLGIVEAGMHKIQQRQAYVQEQMRKGLSEPRAREMAEKAIPEPSFKDFLEKAVWKEMEAPKEAPKSQPDFVPQGGAENEMADFKKWQEFMEKRDPGGDKQPATDSDLRMLPPGMEAASPPERSGTFDPKAWEAVKGSGMKRDAGTGRLEDYQSTKTNPGGRVYAPEEIKGDTPSGANTPTGNTPEKMFEKFQKQGMSEQGARKAFAEWMRGQDPATGEKSATPPSPENAPPARSEAEGIRNATETAPEAAEPSPERPFGSKPDLVLQKRMEEKGLAKRDQDVIKSRLAGSTLDEVGKRLGLTRERVRQIEEKALKKMGADGIKAIAELHQEAAPVPEDRGRRVNPKGGEAQPILEREGMRFGPDEASEVKGAKPWQKEGLTKSAWDLKHEGSKWLLEHEAKAKAGGGEEAAKEVRDLHEDLSKPDLTPDERATTEKDLTQATKERDDAQRESVTTARRGGRSRESAGKLAEKTLREAHEGLAAATEAHPGGQAPAEAPAGSAAEVPGPVKPELTPKQKMAAATLKRGNLSPFARKEAEAIVAGNRTVYREISRTGIDPASMDPGELRAWKKEMGLPAKTFRKGGMALDELTDQFVGEGKPLGKPPRGVDPGRWLLEKMQESFVLDHGVGVDAEHSAAWEKASRDKIHEQIAQEDARSGPDGTDPGSFSDFGASAKQPADTPRPESGGHADGPVDPEAFRASLKGGELVHHKAQGFPAVERDAVFLHWNSDGTAEVRGVDDTNTYPVERDRLGPPLPEEPPRRVGHHATSEPIAAEHQAMIDQLRKKGRNADLLTEGYLNERRREGEEKAGKWLEKRGATGGHPERDVEGKPGFPQPLTDAERRTGGIAGGQEDAAPEGPPLPKRLTALKNEQVDQERKANGLPPLMKQARLANPEVWDKAMETLERDPQAGEKLVKDLAANNRATTVHENALLLQRKIALANDHERAMTDWLRADREQKTMRGQGDAIDLAAAEAKVKEAADREDRIRNDIDQLDKVARATGTEWGRAGQFRKQLAAEDYSLASMMKQAEAAKGRELTPEEKTQIAELQQKIADLQTKLDAAEDKMRAGGRGIAGPEFKERQRAKVEAEAAKKSFRSQLDQDKAAQRPITTKIMDFIHQLKRFAILSNPLTLVKIAAASVERAGFSHIEEGVGAGLSTLPFISRIAALAPRQGRGLSPKAEAKAFMSFFTDGMVDAFKTIRDRHSPLELLHGETEHYQEDKSPGILGRVLEFPGLLHAALKAPAKRHEFTRSFLKRIEAESAAGRDVTSPEALDKIGVEAYKDANRAIFMNDNAVVEAMTKAERHLIKHESGGANVAGHLLKLAIPIKKVPSNIVAEVMEHVAGLPVGLTRTGLALRKGLAELQPAQADSIMRQLKKGSLGSAALLLGYFAPQMFGGFYNGKRKEDELKAGDVKVEGMTIDSHLVHNPLLEVLQVGSSMRRSADKKTKSGSQGLSVGAAEAFLGLVREAPLIREGEEIGTMVSPRSSPKERGKHFGEFLKSLAVPQLVSWLAEQTDRQKGMTEGEKKKRAPETVLGHVGAGIPGVRQRLKAK